MARILIGVEQSNPSSCSYWFAAKNCGGAFVAFRITSLLVLLISSYRPEVIIRKVTVRALRGSPIRANLGTTGKLGLLSLAARVRHFRASI